MDRYLAFAQQGTLAPIVTENCLLSTRRRPFIANDYKSRKVSDRVFAIQVITPSEGEEVMTLQPLLTQRFGDADESERDMAKWLVTNKDVGKVLHSVTKFYAIATGKSIGIYRDWYVTFPIFSTI